VSSGDVASDVAPAEPGPEDCCNSGCENCVWTQHYAALTEWNAARAAAAATVAVDKRAGRQKGKERGEGAGAGGDERA